MVVNHVHADPQTRPVQRIDHCTELNNSFCPVLRITGIAALRRTKMRWVIAPIKTILLLIFDSNVLLRLAISSHMRNF